MTMSDYMAGIVRAESPEAVRELMQRAARDERISAEEYISIVEAGLARRRALVVWP